MGRKDALKPKGRMSAYAFFIQTCREEHKKKHPGETVGFSEFSKKCSDKWKTMGPKEKKRFDDMSAKDKIRYDKEMANYVPSADSKKGGKRKKKDPNAPKRPLSAFFYFCGEERPKVKAANPSFSVGDIAKALGKKWEACTNRAKYDAMATKAKAQYEKDLAAYKKKGGGGGGGGSSPKKAKKAQKVEESEEESEEEEEEDDEEDSEEEEDDE